ncbi:malic enzyme [Gongronella butleri]|nr:malic enzyme [Gongronella butleri]
MSPTIHASNVPSAIPSANKEEPTVNVIPSQWKTSAYHNQGTALDQSQRAQLGINALSPSRVESIDTQKQRAMRLLRSKPTLLEKYIMMAQMRTTNVHLFYKIVIEELEELAPIIYTPTVGTACLEYSNIYPFLAAPGTSDGLYLRAAPQDELLQMIKQYQPFPNEAYKPEIAVISDGSRILGLGDLGVNGIGIPIGKLQLYVSAGGIDPRKTLPIILDLGTNNEKFLADDFYLGLRQRRSDDAEFYASVDRVLQAVRNVYPDILIQFEDWSSEHAFGLLEKYQHELLCFNDDIQGTGAVILSGVMNAVKRVQVESGVQPADHRILFYGAGSAAIGVARQIQEYFQIEHGMSEDQAKRVFWIVDSKGLVTTDRGDKLAQHKVYYARDDNNGTQYKDLLAIVDYIKPTMLIGLSSIPGAFNEAVLTRLGELNEQPIVFPLSNPATQAECSFEQAMVATNNRVIFASGTAFPSFKEQNGKVHIPGQGNNMYIFPGLGLGAVLAHTTKITDRMVYEAAKALSESLTPEEKHLGWLYPSLKRIRHVSALVATAVCEEANRENLSRAPHIIDKKSHDEIYNYVVAHMWSPNDVTPIKSASDSRI